MTTEQDEARLKRVKELEAMVHKLTVENEKLMTRVHSPSTAQLPGEEQDNRPSPTQHSSPGERLINDDEDAEEGVIALSDLDETGEDDWLFVSPMKPPTPKQKKITPTEWLSGETSSRFSEKNLPSLNEVRKTLAASMDEAEQFVKSPKSDRKTKPSNKTAQKNLNKVRQKRHSPTGGSDGSSPRSLSPAEQSPLLSKRQRNVPIRPVIPQGSGKNSTERSTQQASLKVNWTPPKSNTDQDLPAANSLKVNWDPSKAVLSDDDEENEEELEDLRAKWKVRMPVEDKKEETEKQVNPLKVNWTARVPDEGNEEEEEQELKVKWKAHMPVEDNVEIEKQVNPLKVNWTARVPTEDYEEEEEEADPVPVVKWKARMPIEENKEMQVNPLKVNWTARVPTEDYEEEEEVDPVPVVKWKAKQVPEPEEEIQKVHWTVQNVGDPHQSRKQQRQSPNNSATQSLRGNLTPPSQRPKAAANPLKIQWDPSKASPASSEEDLSSQGSGESPQPQRASRYSAHSKLAYPQTTPSPTASGIPGRRSTKPVASISPLQKGNSAVSPVQKRSTGLRQPSPARVAVRQPPPQSQANPRARSLSPDQSAQLSSSNHKNPSPQSRLRSPGTASLGRKAGMKLMKPLGSPSGQMPATTRSTERSSIVPQQGSPNSRPQTTKQLPSPQQHKISPASSARSQGLQQPSSGIRQPSSLRRPTARGGTAQTAQVRPAAKEKWLEDCF